MLPLHLLGCTAKALADAAGVAVSQLSCWRTDTRTPGEDHLIKLAGGIANPHSWAVNAQDVLRDLAETLPKGEDFASVADNLNTLLDTLDIRSAKVAKTLSFDASYLSRIPQGQRVSANVDAFVDGVCRFALRKTDTAEKRADLAVLLGAEPDALRDNTACLRALTAWMHIGRTEVRSDIGEFLKKLDEFDLGEYIRVIHFD